MACARGFWPKYERTVACSAAALRLAWATTKGIRESCSDGLPCHE